MTPLQRHGLSTVPWNDHRLLRPLSRRLAALKRLPEVDLAFFALLVHFPWEIGQSPLFVEMSSAPFWNGLLGCTFAAFGDVLISLISYWAAAAVSGRHWLERPRMAPFTIYMIIGVGITILVEWLATQGRWFEGWTYGPAMPVMPWLDVGLVPVLQWLVLPPIVLALASRRLRAHRA